MTVVSVIMPYYKKEAYIYESVESILNQTFKEFEIIIIDDELTINSSKVLEKIEKLDPKIKIIRNQKNEGAGESRNNAINICRGEYIAFCDCDDLWNSQKLEKQLNFMRDHSVEFSFTSYQIIDNKNLVIEYRKAKDNLNFKELRNSCDIGLSTVMINNKIFQKKNLRFANTKTKEDFILWLLIAKNGIKMFGVKENLVSWRKNSDSLSSDTFQKIIDGYRVYRNYLDYGVIKSLFFLFILSANFILKKIK